MRHRRHSIAANSVRTHREEARNFGERALAVLDYLKERGPCTDREIMRGLGFGEPNAVRPRVTELLQRGLLVQMADKKCQFSGKTVRVVAIPAPPIKITEQQTFAFQEGARP